MSVENYWKKLARQCGRTLQRPVLNVLCQLDLEDLREKNVVGIRHQILAALSRAVSVTEKQSTARDLSYVVKYGVDTIDSLLMCFGITPFKLRCRLPNYTSFSVSDARLCCPDLPHIEYKGEFRLIKKLCTVNIYVYSFSDTVSCSNVHEGGLHYQLPAPEVSSPITVQEIHKRKASIGAGNAYLHLHENATEVNYIAEGKCAVAYNYSSLQQDVEATEVVRTEKLKQHLKSILPTLYDGITVDIVESVKKRSGANFCHFTGGGDLKLTRTDFVFLLLTHTESEYGENSPTRDDECRKTLDIECKASHSKPNEEVRLQLQADMYNLLVREFISKVKDADDDQFEKIVSKLSQLSIYGMSFGISRPVEVLKLTVDFSANKLTYYSKFKSSPGFPQEPIIDSCIAAVLDRLGKKSPPQH